MHFFSKNVYQFELFKTFLFCNDKSFCLRSTYQEFKITVYNFSSHSSHSYFIWNFFYHVKFNFLFTNSQKYILKEINLSSHIHKQQTWRLSVTISFIQYSIMSYELKPIFRIRIKCINDDKRRFLWITMTETFVKKVKYMT